MLTNYQETGINSSPTPRISNKKKPVYHHFLTNTAGKEQWLQWHHS